MAVLELYGKCKELGYCDCDGFFGCSNPDKFAANKPLVAMVECTVCDRSHAPNHPHIANIDGDTPIDDEPESLGAPVERELPSWLRDKPGSQVIRPASSSSSEAPKELCQVCGKPWAPRHECLEVEDAGTRAFNPRMNVKASHGEEKLCDACGKIKRSNHNCRGAAPAEKPCTYCERAGEPCVRHGGERSSVRAAKRYEERKTAGQRAVQAQTDERVATELPKPTPVMPPATEAISVPQPEFDRELAAIGTILTALEGLDSVQIKRAFAYVADRKGIKQETES